MMQSHSKLTNKKKTLGDTWYKKYNSARGKKNEILDVLNKATTERIKDMLKKQ